MLCGDFGGPDTGQRTPSGDGGQQLYRSLIVALLEGPAALPDGFLRGLITVASLIEEETASATESHKIASVIYNRLYNWGSSPRFLNIDAAIFYALGEHKSALTSEDLQIDSPYNTYVYQGLVPGPISNPGLDSIKAALDPENTSYYYYVLNPAEGKHDFSKTLDEHEKKVDKYLRGG